MTGTKRQELPPLRNFDFMGRQLILRHKLQPLVDERVIHGLENDHEVKTLWGTNSRGEGDLIAVVRFRVLFGVREYIDFYVTDNYEICEDKLDATLHKDSWDGSKLTDLVRATVASKLTAVA